MSSLSIMSLDDTDFIYQHAISKQLGQEWKITLVKSVDESIEALRKDHFDVLLLDNDLGKDHPTGIQLISCYLREFPNLVIIIVTNGDDIESMKQAFALGADDYVVKSATLCDDLRSRIPECINRNLNRRLADAYRKEVDYPEPYALIGTSDAVSDLKEDLKPENQKGQYFIIYGEPGTGRFDLARYLWRLKATPNRPFVSVHISKIPKGKHKEVLFGGKDQTGAFTTSALGDLVITAFDQLEAGIQRQVFQTIKSKKFSPSKSARSLPISCRVILICSNMPSLSKQFKQFMPMHTPTLRDRAEDIGLIVATYFSKYKLKNYHLTPSALEFLEEQEWPGNISQLIGLLDLVINDLHHDRREKIEISDLLRAKRAFHLTKVSIELLLPSSKEDITPKFYNSSMATFERQLIIHALDKFEDDVGAAAKSIGLSRATFYRKITELNIALDH